MRSAESAIPCSLCTLSRCSTTPSIFNAICHLAFRIPDSFRERVRRSDPRTPATASISRGSTRTTTRHEDRQVLHFYASGADIQRDFTAGVVVGPATQCVGIVHKSLDHAPLHKCRYANWLRLRQGNGPAVFDGGQYTIRHEQLTPAGHSDWRGAECFDRAAVLRGQSEGVSVHPLSKESRALFVPVPLASSR